MTFLTKLELSGTFVGFVICVIYIFYNFICFFFSFGISFIMFFIEFFYFLIFFIFFDFTSFSSHLNILIGNHHTFQISFCSYLFCLFYFVILFIFCFVFFVIRCFFVISTDFIFQNFDIHYSILMLDVALVDYITFIILYLGFICGFVIGLFSFLFTLSLPFLAVYFLLAIYYAYSFSSATQNVNLFHYSYWLTLNYNRTFVHLSDSSLHFFKYIYCDVFFVFVFLLVLFLVSYFGFFIKDFVFLTIFFEMFNDILLYNTKTQSVYSVLVAQHNLTQLTSIYM